MPRIGRIAALLAVLPFASVLAICGGVIVPPPPPPPPGLPGTGDDGEERTGFPERYEVGGYEDWWNINRDARLLAQGILDEPPPAPPVPVAPADPAYEVSGEEGAAQVPASAEASPAAPPGPGAPAPVDPPERLLAVVGYDAHFSAVVREIALRRLRADPGAGEALVRILSDSRQPDLLRAWAAYAIGELSEDGSLPPAAVPALVQALRSDSVDIRGFAVRALGGSPDPAAARAVATLVLSRGENEDVRALGLLSMARSPLPDARDVLRRVAREERSLVPRRAAILSLGVSPQPQDVALLTDLAGNVDPPARAAAMIALSLAVGSDGSSPSLALVRRALASDRDPRVRGYAALGLGIVGDPSLSAELLAALDREKDPRPQGACALALGRCGGAQAVARLQALLRDRHYAYLSAYAAIGLGLTEDASALPVLGEGLASPRADVVVASMTGVSLLGLPEGTDLLLPLAERRNYEGVRQFVYQALGRLRGSVVYDRLVAALEDVAPAVRMGAALGLAQYGDPRALEALREGLADRDPSVRNTMAIASDLLTVDPSKPLALGDVFRANPNATATAGVRRVDSGEVRALFNERFLPDDFRLPIGP